MRLRIKNFNIMGVHRKIWFLLGGSQKNNIYGEIFWKVGGGLQQFADLRGAWQKRMGWCFWGVWYPSAHNDASEPVIIFFFWLEIKVIGLLIYSLLNCSVYQQLLELCDKPCKKVAGFGWCYSLHYGNLDPTEELWHMLCRVFEHSFVHLE